jgi:hypothetical protein
MKWKEKEIKKEGNTKKGRKEETEKGSEREIQTDKKKETNIDICLLPSVLWNTITKPSKRLSPVGDTTPPPPRVQYVLNLPISH